MELGPNKTPWLLIDIDIETNRLNHIVRSTIATRPLVKWCTVKYHINENTNEYSVVLRIKYKGIKKPFEIEIDKIDKNTMYALYDALLNCIKYKTVEHLKTSTDPLKDESIATPKLTNESKNHYRYVTLKVEPRVVVLDLFDFDDTHAAFSFERLK